MICAASTTTSKHHAHHNYNTLIVHALLACWPLFIHKHTQKCTIHIYNNNISSTHEIRSYLPSKPPSPPLLPKLTKYKNIYTYKDA